MDRLLHSVLIHFALPSCEIFNSNMMRSVKSYQTYRDEKKITFFVEPADYVVHVVWEKTPAVQYC